MFLHFNTHFWNIVDVERIIKKTDRFLIWVTLSNLVTCQLYLSNVFLETN